MFIICNGVMSLPDRRKNKKGYHQSEKTIRQKTLFYELRTNVVVSCPKIGLH